MLGSEEERGRNGRRLDIDGLRNKKKQTLSPQSKNDDNYNTTKNFKETRKKKPKVLRYSDEKEIRTIFRL